MMRRVGLSLLLGLTACAPSSGSNEVPVPDGAWLEHPFGPMPANFADVGLYLDGGNPTVVPDRALPYEPRWPLWSSGSEKHRHLVLPEGAKVDNSTEAWVFPPGTALFKTFGYPRDGVFVPVETRVMHVEEDGGWAYEGYQWDAAGRTAEKLELTFSTEVTVDTDAGALSWHSRHSRRAGMVCCSAPVYALGFEALQLGDDPALADAFTHPLDPPQALGGGDASTDAVLGLFVGQCVHCHNGSDGPSSAFDLRPDVALQNTIGVETESSAMASGVRIIAGDPAGSILFQAFSGETDDPEVGDMPPLGIDRRDTEAIEVLRSWIAAL